MTTVSRTLTLQLMLIACAWLSAGAGWAQNYPVKSIRYVVPSSAGGGADFLGRVIARGLAEVFNQQVIVDNRAGASGNIAAELVAAAPADGYTLLQSEVIHAANVSLFKNLPYDIVRDFAPVTQTDFSSSVLVAHPSLPAKSIRELIRLAKARPGAITIATAGTGSSSYLAMALFAHQAAINLVHVPYRGGGAAITGILTGESSLFFAPLSSAAPLIQHGRLRALAVTTAGRNPAVPDYPTVAEGGLPGFEYVTWHGLVVPARTPREVIAKLHDATVSVLRDPVLSKQLREHNYVLVGSQPDAFAAYIKSEIARLSKVISQLRPVQ